MNKKILYLSLAVVVLILCASSVTAFVSPPPGIKDPTFSKVWAAIMDLQKQITNIQLTPGPTGPTGATGAQGTAGPAGSPGKDGSTVVTKSGHASDNDDITVPAGFKTGQCTILNSVASVQCGSYQDVLYTIHVDTSPNFDEASFKIREWAFCRKVSDDSVYYAHIESQYSMVCTS